MAMQSLSVDCQDLLQECYVREMYIFKSMDAWESSFVQLLSFEAKRMSQFEESQSND